MSEERAHSIFSASGSERWLKCAYSVEAEKDEPNRDTPWSLEGTHAHLGLELRLLLYLALIKKDRKESAKRHAEYKEWENHFDTNKEMINHVAKVAADIIKIAEDAGAELTAETRIHQAFIHKDMFGTTDAIIPQFFGTLHVVDFKYGAGHVVSPIKNTQMIQYALGAAHEHDWNFYDVTMHIMQPRAGGHSKWTITIEELKNLWLPVFQKGVKRVLKGGNKPFPGSHCHWCKAKYKCPAKEKVRQDKVADAFKQNPFKERK